jgi:heat-inducible transcriptional repressor
MKYAGRSLSRRERVILRLVVKSFIETAGPVGSRFLASRFQIGLSSASVRNTMSDLEAMGYLDHPHTSAGRIPTRLGYRAFVDDLMEDTVLSGSEKLLMRSTLVPVADRSDSLFQESSRLLARLAGLLGVVLSPRLRSGKLERLEVVPVSSDRVMIVLSIEGGLLRTIILNIAAPVKERSRLDQLVVLLNERLCGLTLDEIRRTCVPRVSDLRGDDTGIVQLIKTESAVLFSDPPEDRTVEVEGTSNILAQPEFSKVHRIRNLVAFLDNSSSVVKLLEDNPEGTEVGRAQIRIGELGAENSVSNRLENMSVVTATYRRSNLTGTIGVIGPTRMNYPRVVALVEGVSQMMSWPESGGSTVPEA